MAVVLETSALDTIRPEDLYPRKKFLLAAGLSETRIYQAREQYGITLPMLSVGKRKFVRGRDGIEYIERLAQSRRSSQPKAE